MRPRGSYGEVASALLDRAEEPGTVREIALRAQVSVPVARYTISRLVDRGDLVVLDGSRPATVMRAAAEDAADDPFELLERSFWELPPAGN